MHATRGVEAQVARGVRCIKARRGGSSSFAAHTRHRRGIDKSNGIIRYNRRGIIHGVNNEKESDSPQETSSDIRSLNYRNPLGNFSKHIIRLPQTQPTPKTCFSSCPGSGPPSPHTQGPTMSTRRDQGAGGGRGGWRCHEVDCGATRRRLLRGASARVHT
jgi:hypothetical protein